MHHDEPHVAAAHLSFMSGRHKITSLRCGVLYMQHTVDPGTEGMASYHVFFFSLSLFFVALFVSAGAL